MVSDLTAAIEVSRWSTGTLLFKTARIRRIMIEPVRTEKDTRFCVTLNKIHVERYS
jgi:hypothetical protein